MNCDFHLLSDCPDKTATVRSDSATTAVTIKHSHYFGYLLPFCRDIPRLLPANIISEIDKVTEKNKHMLFGSTNASSISSRQKHRTRK